MLDLQKPLMLDGDIPGAMDAFSPGPEECLEEWLLQNPGLLFNVLAAFRDAGADAIPSMTYQSNILRLSDFELGAEHDRFNARLVELTAQAVPETLVAGGMGPSGHLPEPFGPLPYTDLIDTYAEQAIALASAGARFLLIEGMPSLYEARPAVMGAKQAHLPIVVSMQVGEEGRGVDGSDPLASLICLQELGVAAFGLCCDHSPQALVAPLKRIAPYAKVPLMARPGLEDIQPDDVSRSCWELLAAGVRILGGGKGAGADHMSALRVLIDEFDYEAFPPPSRSEDTAVLLTDSREVYYLEEGFERSAPIACDDDMADAILKQEDADCLLVHLRNIDDAWQMSQNIHLARQGVCFSADTAEALEMGLLYYSGRALVDGASPISPKTLRYLAEGYGAAVLDRTDSDGR